MVSKVRVGPSRCEFQATKKLRAMLDERGIEWRRPPKYSSESLGNETIFSVDGFEWYAYEYDEGYLWLRPCKLLVTPEQVIAATVGNRDTMELWPEWEQVLFANVSDEVAQDNLNECVHELLDKAATMGAGTCHIEECEHEREIPYDLPDCDGGWYTEVTHDCDECGYENADPNIRFCGGCGRKVVAE